MIIISQDKTMILNFEYIETIEIENPLENNDGKFKILCDTTNCKKIFKLFEIRRWTSNLTRTDGYTT